MRVSEKIVVFFVEGELENAREEMVEQPHSQNIVQLTHFSPNFCLLGHKIFLEGYHIHIGFLDCAFGNEFEGHSFHLWLLKILFNCWITEGDHTVSSQLLHQKILVICTAKFSLRNGSEDNLDFSESVPSIYLSKFDLVESHEFLLHIWK